MWAISRIKYVADFEPKCDFSSLSPDSLITYTPMENIKNGYFIPNVAALGTLSTSLTAYQDNDIVMAKVTPCFENGNIAVMSGLSSGVGLGSSELFVFRAKEMQTRYLFYWLQNKAFIEQAKSTMTGTGGLKRVSPQFVRDCTIHCPPPDEQARIAAFLDVKCARINTVIEQTRASIEEYKKLKQAVITQAVTKGIRPGRKMKDSGVEWIGEIPEEWTVLRKLSYAVNKSISYGIVKLFDPDDISGVRVLRCSDVREGKIDTSNIRTVAKAVSDEYSRTLLEGGEVLINVRGTLGGCAVVPPEMRGYNIAREVAMISLTDAIINRYLMYYFLSKTFGTYEERHLAGSVYVGLNIEMLAACPVTLPPLPEQEHIADYLDNKCQAFDTVIAKKSRIIQELESYKKSLIFEYVTGKKEV